MLVASAGLTLGLDCMLRSFPFRTRDTSHYTQTKRSVLDEMSGIVQEVAVSDKVSEIAMEEQAHEHEV